MHVEFVRAIFEYLDKTSGEEMAPGVIENGLNVTEVLGRGIARAGGDRGVVDLFGAAPIVVSRRVFWMSLCAA